MKAKAMQDNQTMQVQAKIATDNNQHQNDMELESHKQFHERYIKGQDRDMKEMELQNQNQTQNAEQ
jgi:hypothetical protein